MPAYVIAQVRAVRDQDALVEYRTRNTPTVTAHGGRFIVRGGPIEHLEGDAPLRFVVMEFPDAATARAWYESEDYAPLKAIRQAASDTDIVIVEGGDTP
jgi:uncharacterized protein (DUF1330 family)